MLTVAELAAHDHSAAAGAMDANQSHGHSGTTAGMNGNQTHSHSGTTGGMKSGNPHQHYSRFPDPAKALFVGSGGQMAAPLDYITVATDAADVNHGHDFTTSSVNLDHAHGFSTSSVNIDHSHPVTVASRGGGAGHNNMPPFLALNWIVKAGIPRA